MQASIYQSESIHPLHFIGFWPDYEQAFFQVAQAQATQLSLQVFNPLVKTQQIPSFTKWPRLLRNVFHKRLIAEYIQTHPEGLLVAHEHRLILELLLAKFPQRKAHILMRNPLNPQTKTEDLLQSLQALDYTIWSFDPADCAQYGFKFYRQFIEVLMELAVPIPQYDFAFVGRNKGREAVLLGLEAKLKQLGYSVYLDLRSDQAKGVKANIPYPLYLQQSLKARCMIDLSQIGQTGLTLRPLEAMSYQRKLLTNNPRIRQEAFYDPANVWIFDEGLDLTGLESFMQQAFKPLPPEQLALYSVGSLAQTLRQSV